jgi:hypothetical protein
MVDVILVTTPSVDGNQVSVTNAILTACLLLSPALRETLARHRQEYLDHITYML